MGRRWRRPTHYAKTGAAYQAWIDRLPLRAILNLGCTYWERWRPALARQSLTNPAEELSDQTALPVAATLAVRSDLEGFPRHCQRLWWHEIIDPFPALRSGIVGAAGHTSRALAHLLISLFLGRGGSAPSQWDELLIRQLRVNICDSSGADYGRTYNRDGLEDLRTQCHRWAERQSKRIGIGSGLLPA